MSRKSALIVDDSRTASQVLGRMLEKHELDVDTVVSAEDALRFLDDAHPDVIFMDHTMPGMDGFQAVRSIKNNPDTADIPIMMYTSQGGELYAGQARALGAAGVLPKQSHNFDVGEILESLNIVTELPGVDEKPSSDKPALKVASLVPELPVVKKKETPAVGKLVDEAVERTVEAVSEKLDEVLEKQLLASRTLRDDFNDLGQGLKDIQAEQEIINRRLREFDEPEPSRWPEIGLQLMVLAAVCAVGWLIWDTRPEPAPVVVSTPQPVAAPADLGGLLARVEADLNASPEVALNEIPLSGARLAKLDDVIRDLEAAGFRGTVAMESHLGDFCMTRNLAGELEPAGAGLPVTECDSVGFGPEVALTKSGAQSTDFSGYLSRATAAASGIVVAVQPRGNREPAVPYPVPDQTTTAGDWNAIAAANTRVVFRLIPTP